MSANKISPESELKEAQNLSNLRRFSETDETIVRLAGVLFAGDLLLVGLILSGLIICPWVVPAVVATGAFLLIAYVAMKRFKEPEMIGVQESQIQAFDEFSEIEIRETKGKEEDNQSQKPNPDCQKILELEQEKFRKRLHSKLDEADVQKIIQKLDSSEDIRYVASGIPLQGQPSEEKKLTVYNINIKGQGLTAHLMSRLFSSEPVYAEDHSAGFIVDHTRKTIEYFDPKLTPLHSKFQTKTGQSVIEMRNTLQKQCPGYDFYEYRERYEIAPQHWMDRETCGLHFCRRVEQYLSQEDKNKDPEGLTSPSREELAEVRNRYFKLAKD